MAEANSKSVEPKDGEKKEIEIVIDGTKFKVPFRTFTNGTKLGYGVYSTVKINNYPYKISCSIFKM